MDSNIKRMLFTVVLFLSIIVRADLLLHYEFDEGAGGTAASSVNSTVDNTLNLLNEGTDTGWTTGVSGGALQIITRSGGAGAAVPTSWALAGASNLTLSMWINRIGTSAANPSLAGALDDVGGTWQHHYMIRADGVNFDSRGFIRDIGNANTLQTANDDPATALLLNTWTHLAITFDAASKTLSYYVNGDLKSTAVSAGWNGWNDGSTLDFAGIGNPNGSYTIPGLYDDVRIYDEVLSAEAIAELAGYEPPDPPSDLGPIEVYLLAGQSNMQGVGYSSDLTAEQKDQPEILLYHTSSVSSGQPANTWIALRPAGWSGFGAGGCFGPEIGFGLEIAKRYPSSKIAFIKHAVGGTGISPDCAVSGWYPVHYPARPDADDQYAAFINAAHSALDALESQGYQLRIRGMLWMQGEEDAKLVSTGNDYEANLSLLISTVRTEFDLSEMPFVYAQILPHCFDARFSARDIVRQAQANLDQNSGHADAVHNAFMVSTDSLSVHSQIPGDPRPTDDVHFGTDGQLGLGLLMGQQFPRQGDVQPDGKVTLSDFAVIAAYWMDIDCSISNDWCDGADVTLDSTVSIEDLDALSLNWLLE